jgi:uncharacterized protein (DUF885 family)
MRLPDYSPEALGAVYDAEMDRYDELLSFDRSALSADQQREYDALAGMMANTIDDEFLLYYNIFTGAIPELPIVLAEYKLYTKDDIGRYIRLLADMPDMVDGVSEYLHAQVEAGLFMPDSAIDGAVEQMEQFIYMEPNILVTSFEERLDSFPELTAEEREQYIEDNRNAIDQYILPGFQAMIDDLTNLRGRGSEKLPKMAEYYRQLVRQETGLSEGIDEIYAALEQKLAELDAEFEALRDNYTDLDDSLDNLNYGDTDPQSILESLREKINEDFPPLEGVEYAVKELPVALQDLSYVAFYLSPPIDEATQNVIYVNDKNSDDSTIFQTMAHEGYPGHLYQSNYENGRVSPLRAFYGISSYAVGYSEGWAFYVELLSYDWVSYKETNPECAEYLRMNTLVWMVADSLLDIGINYKGWTIEDAIEEMAEYYTAEEIEWFYPDITQDPGSMIKYAAPYLKIEGLKERAQQAMGDDFNIMEFHKTILDLGLSNFDLVEEAINDYIGSTL